MKTRIHAGDLRQQIRIVTRNLQQDSFGGTKIDDASTFATVWASVEALTGKELYAAQQTVAEVTHKITIRYLEGVKSSMNVWFGSRQFQIASVQNPDERTKMLILLCIERDDSVNEVPA